MPDYAQLAIEAKAKQEAAELQRAARQKLDSNIREYFGQLHAALRVEIDKANEELRRQDVATFSGIATTSAIGTESSASELAGQIGEPTLSIQYGENRYCYVRLRTEPPELDAKLTGDVEIAPDARSDDSWTHLTWFFLGRDTGLMVNRTNYIPGVDKSPTVQDIAETIVAGMIRGYFD